MSHWVTETVGLSALLSFTLLYTSLFTMDLSISDRFIKAGVFGTTAIVLGFYFKFYKQKYKNPNLMKHPRGSLLSALLYNKVKSNNCRDERVHNQWFHHLGFWSQKFSTSRAVISVRKTGRTPRWRSSLQRICPRGNCRTPRRHSSLQGSCLREKVIF